MTNVGLPRWISRRRRTVRLRRVLLTALLVGTLLFVGAGWVGLRGWQTRGHLTSAAGLAQQLSGQVLAGDTAQARRTLDALQRQTAAARSSSGDPAWWLAGQTPVGGANLVAVHAVAETIDELARRTFPRLLAIEPAALLPHGGRMDLAALGRAVPQLTAADDSLHQITTGFQSTPSRGLLAPVQDAVDQLRTSVDQLAAVTSTARRAVGILPPLLGAKGPRTYLIAFQNLAEARATGGIFGAYAVLRVADGRAAVVKQGTAASFGQFATPLPLGAELRRLYTDLPGVYPADVNLSPDFPTAAALYREMYRRHTGETVDGVLATDPVALSYLLRAIGPVTISGSPQLVPATAVRALLSDAYRRLPSSQAQDTYFAEAAKAVFQALISRSVEPRALLGAIDQASNERRLLLWSAHPDEQRTIATTSVGGVLPDREATPTVGVFLNDGSGAKLGYYLTHRAALTVGDCRPDGRRELTLRVTLGSTAPKSGLKPAVLGLGMAGNPYTARTLVSVFSPAGGTVLQARLDGKPAPIGTGRERRRQVGIATVDLAPGRTRVLDVALLTPVTGAGTAALWLTPGVNPWTTQIDSAPSCQQ